MDADVSCEQIQPDKGKGRESVRIPVCIGDVSEEGLHDEIQDQYGDKRLPGCLLGECVQCRGQDEKDDIGLDKPILVEREDFNEGLERRRFRSRNELKEEREKQDLEDK